MKILILSDMHLGHRASRAGVLLEDLRRVARGYDRVILNGDTLDRYEAPQPGAEQLIRDVTDACACRGGAPELVMGNHDPAISQTDWIYLPQSQTLVFHGDCMDDWTHPTKDRDQMLRGALAQEWHKSGGRPESFVELLARYRPVQLALARRHPPIQEPKSAWHYLVAMFFPPRKPFDVLSYWWRAPGRVSRMAAGFSEPVRHVVIGHTHLPGRWQACGRTVFNTGSFMPFSKACAVQVDGARVRLTSVQALLRAGPTVCPPLKIREPEPAEKAV